MKKILFSLLCLFVSSTAFATDYWVYIKTEDESGLTKEQDIGRSKEGDVIIAIPAVEGEEPTAREKEIYKILTLDLTEAEAEELVEPLWEDKTKHIIKAYRKNKIDLTKLDNKTKGFSSKKISKSKFKSIEKTQDDLDKYETKRLAYKYLKYPFIQLANLIIPYSFGATTSKICAVGSNCTDEDYNTLQAWEDDKDGDADQTQTAEVYDDDGAISGNVSLGGWTTGSAVVTITAPSVERHDGTATSGAKLIGTNGGTIIGVSDDNLDLTVSWLVMEANPNTWQDSGSGIKFTAIPDLTVHNNIIYLDDDTVDYARNGAGIDTGGATVGGTVTMYNNIIYDFQPQGTGTGGKGINAFQYSGTYLIYNNTVYNCDTGINARSDATVTGRNNLANGNDTDYSVTFDTSSNNISEDTSSPDTSYRSLALTFKNITNKDFHLFAGDTDAIGEGYDLSGTFTDDIDGDTRSSWDIGADDHTLAGDGVGEDWSSNQTIHWKANDTGTGTVFTDAEGNLNLKYWDGDADDQNVTGLINDAVQFGTTVSGKRILIASGGTADGLTTDYSLAFWVKLDADYSSASTADMYIYGTNVGNFYFYATTGQFRFRTKDGAVWSDLFSDKNSWNSGEWYHIVCSWDGVTKKIYVNGEVQGTTDNDGEMDANNNVIYIGSSYTSSAKLDGALDDIRTFDDALTDDEIFGIYNGGTGTEDNSIAGGTVSRRFMVIM